jgi:hypothetical protein
VRLDFLDDPVFDDPDLNDPVPVLVDDPVPVLDDPVPVLDDPVPVLEVPVLDPWASIGNVVLRRRQLS